MTIAFHCTKSLLTFPSYRYDLNNVERDVRLHIIIINTCKVKSKLIIKPLVSI